MTAPRRYRLALRAYPRGYRKSRGAELLATLADGDEDRGHASVREAAALAYRGMLERARIATSGEGLLVLAAGLVLFTMVFGLTWAERLYLFRGEVAAMGTDAPGTWSGAALLISAFTILAAGPLRALDSARRRNAVVAAFFLALLVWPAPGSIFKYGIPNPVELAEFMRWNLSGIYSNWQVTVPFAAVTAAGTWLALRMLSRLRPAARGTALAAGLFAAGAVAVTLVATRPDLPAEYGRSAFADLGSAAFVTGLSMLLALVAASAKRSTESKLSSP
jgi:hypothetical protein